MRTHECWQTKRVKYVRSKKALLRVTLSKCAASHVPPSAFS
jgi:hypothetical protein